MCANTPRKKCNDHICCFCTLILLVSLSPRLCFIPSICERMTGFIFEQCRHYKPEGCKAVITCISLLNLTDSLSALLHMKAAFCHLPAVLFALGGTVGQPLLICRDASEPSPLFCAAGRCLEVWKAHSQGTILLGKQGKHFLFLLYTCLWVNQPLSAKLSPAWLALRAHSVPKSQPAVTS